MSRRRSRPREAIRLNVTLFPHPRRRGQLIVQVTRLQQPPIVSAVVGGHRVKAGSKALSMRNLTLSAVAVIPAPLRTTSRTADTHERPQSEGRDTGV